MANPYYGNVGDVWKHLALAALLAGEQPRRYCESHAGAAAYSATRARRSQCDYWDFVARAPFSPILQRSTYFVLLRDLLGERDARYPGSPLIALRLLNKAAKEYVFADVDGESLASIAEAAQQLGLAASQLTLVHGDGLAALLERSPRWQDETLAFLDPFLPSEESEAGISSIELLGRLAQGGVKAVLWYPILSRVQHSQVRSEIKANLGGRPAIRSWCGEILLSEEVGEQAGLLGCGLVASNVRAPTLRRCAALGTALAGILPSGSFLVPSVSS